MRWDRTVDDDTKIVTLSVDFTPSAKRLTIMHVDSDIVEGPHKGGSEDGELFYVDLTDEQVSRL